MFDAPYPYLLLLLPAAVLARDDFRTRRVGILWLAALGAAAVVAAWSTQGARAAAEHMLCNSVLLLVSGAALTCYLRLRRLPAHRSIGAGDIIFITALTPLFAPAAFLRFLLAACIVALIWWAGCGRRSRTVPFVGAAGIALAGWVALRFIRLWI